MQTGTDVHEGYGAVDVIPLSVLPVIEQDNLIMFCTTMEQLEREWNVIPFVGFFHLKGEHHIPKQFQQLQWY